VVSDCAPSAPAVCVGSRVCVRTDADSAEFQTGRVREKRAPGGMFGVDVDGASTTTVWVCRAQLRLLQASLLLSLAAVVITDYASPIAPV